MDIKLSELKIVNGGIGGWINPRPEQLTIFILTKTMKEINKKNIESLGWILDHKTPFGNTYKLGDFTLLTLKETNNISTIHYQSIKFTGDIKNRSELKKLMKQLWINILIDYEKNKDNK